MGYSQLHVFLAVIWIRISLMWIRILDRPCLSKRIRIRSEIEKIPKFCYLKKIKNIILQLMTYHALHELVIYVR